MEHSQVIPLRLLLIGAVILLTHGPLAAQDEVTWERDTVDGITFEFPSPYHSYDTGDARGLIYQEGNVFITLTTIPDTTGRPFASAEDYREFYREILAKAVRTLKGKVLEVTDTIHDNTPAHFSRVEVQHSQGRVTHYELLQIVVGTTLHAFSCQYEPSDASAKVMRDRFFKSIGASGSEEVPTSPSGFPLYLVAMIVLIVILVAVYRRSVKGARANVLLSLA